MTENSEEFRARRENILLRQLVRITRLMMDDTVARMQARGFSGMMPAYPRLLGNLDTEGTRIGALARKMGTTRQAAAQLAVDIEKAGFVARHPDPDDGRGVIVRFTPEGRAALANAVEVMDEIEAEYAGIIGWDRLAATKASLREILAQLDMAGKFGID